MNSYPNKLINRANGFTLINYGMNSKALANENLNTTVTILKVSMIAHPSIFVLFSDVRDRSAAADLSKSN